MWDFCLLTGFENVSKIELDQSSLAYTDTKHWTRYSKRFHSTNFRGCYSVCQFEWLYLSVGCSDWCLVFITGIVLLSGIQSLKKPLFSCTVDLSNDIQYIFVDFHIFWDIGGKPDVIDTKLSMVRWHCCIKYIPLCVSHGSHMVHGG